jgi:hypothetical protein
MMMKKMNKEIKKVWNKKSGDVGYRWREIVFVIEDLGDREPGEILEPIISWIESQKAETIESISIVCVNAFFEFIDLFFEGKTRKLRYKSKLGDYSLSVYPDGLSGGTLEKSKSVWEKFGKELDDWIESPPVDWGAGKKVWDNELGRKDIWGG